MKNNDLLDFQFLDEIVGYEILDDYVIMRKKYPKKIGQSNKIIWGKEEETSIEFLGALSELKFLKLREYIYQNCEYVESPFKELWIKDYVEIKGLEKKVKKGHYIIGRLPEGKEFKLWISPKIKEKKEAYEKPTIQRSV